MIPAILLCIGAATFGLCFLVDRLIQRLRHKNAPPKPCVRQPKRAISIGIVLVFVGIAVSLFVGGALALVCGCLIVLMGAVLVGSYFLFSIHYDAEGFTYRSLKGSGHYLYNQIRGEQAIATRSGITVMLYVGDTIVEMSEAMQGVREFLSHAYAARCRQMNLDPATCPPPAPRELVWFPEPPEE